MQLYTYNKNTDEKGRNEVHTTICSHRPEFKNSVGLVYADNCKNAIISLKERQPKLKFNGCKYCCHTCHKE